MTQRRLTSAHTLDMFARPHDQGDVMAENFGLPRRDFLKVAGASAGLLMLGGCAVENPAVPGIRLHRRIPLVGSLPDIIVVGAGVWGGWTALHLCRMGAK